MRILLLIVAYLVAQIAAYGVPGAYERLFLWYAYKADVMINNGRASTIFSECPNCSFNEFIRRINTATISTPSITTDDFPDIDSTADRLKDAKITGPFNIDNIYKGAGMSWPAMIDGVAKFVKDNRSRIKALNNPLYRGLSISIARVHYARALASSEAIVKKIDNTYKDKDKITINYNQKSMFSGAPADNFVDAATTENNTGKPIKQMAKDVVDDSHGNNVKAARNARAKICK